MTRQLVDYDTDEGVATLTLANPASGNAYTVELAEQLVSALDRADADPEVRAVVLAAAGKHFCVGADLSGGGFTDPGTELPEGWRDPAGLVTMRVFEMGKPVIAAIHGAAVGAGSTIILSCDYRLASPDARFGYVFSRRGIYPEGVSAWFLPKLVGLGRALDWMVSGRLIPASEAERFGLVHSLHDDVDAAAQDLARDLARRTAPVSVAVIRRLLFHAAAQDTPYPTQELDSRLLAQALSSADAVEGVRSFFERRDPQFPGRVPADLPTFLPWRRPTTTGRGAP